MSISDYGFARAQAAYDAMLPPEPRFCRVDGEDCESPVLDECCTCCRDDSDDLCQYPCWETGIPCCSCCRVFCNEKTNR